MTDSSRGIEKGGGRLSRRDFLKLAGITLGGAAFNKILAACSPVTKTPPLTEQPKQLPNNEKINYEQKAAEIGLPFARDMVNDLMDSTSDEKKPQLIALLNNNIATANLVFSDQTKSFTPVQIENTSGETSFLILTTPDNKLNYIFKSQGGDFALAQLFQAENGDRVGIDPIKNQLVFVDSTPTPDFTLYDNGGKSIDSKPQDTTDQITGRVGVRVEISQDGKTNTPEPFKYEQIALKPITEVDSPIQPLDNSVGYYLPQIKEAPPLVPTVPEDLLQLQLVENPDKLTVDFNQELNHVQVFDDKKNIVAEAIWTEKTNEDGTKQFIWEWGTPFIKTDKGTELRGPTEKLKKDAINPFVDAMKMAGIEVTADQVNQDLIIQELKDKDGNSFMVTTYNLNPDLTNTNEAFEGPIPLAIVQKGENEEWEWGKIFLRNLAEKTGIRIGAEALGEGKDDEKGRFKIFAEQFNQMTIMNLSWKRSEPTKPTDIQKIHPKLDVPKSLLQKALKNNQAATFLWLIYGNSGDMPDSYWLRKNNFTKDEAITIMQNHIRAVMRLNRSVVDQAGVDIPLQYIVVNEGVNEPHYYWASKIGPEYIELAFQEARTADSKATLIYNDYGHELPNMSNANGVFKVVKNLKDKGLIDGVGMQMHFIGRDNINPNISIQELEKGIRAQIDRYAQVGVRVYITEFDVDLSKINGTIQDKLQKAYEIYRMVTKVCAKSGNCDGISVFGVNSESSWISGMGGQSSLLFSENKPSANYYAVLTGLFDSLN